MDKIKVFLDSDVIISALLSRAGASFAIIQNELVIKTISKTIKEELREVTKRLNINLAHTDIFDHIETVSLTLTKTKLSQRFSRYVLDQEDSHVVVGAYTNKSKFLLTHNMRHFRTHLLINLDSRFRGNDKTGYCFNSGG